MLEQLLGDVTLYTPRRRQTDVESGVDHATILHFSKGSCTSEMPRVYLSSESLENCKVQRNYKTSYVSPRVHTRFLYNQVEYMKRGSLGY